jgi:multidrug efflux pump subunit AcrA (membrane-fusion protein)
MNMKRDIVTNHSYADAFAAPKLRLLILLTGATLAALMLLAGCTPSGLEQQPLPPPVTVGPVEQKEIVEWNEFTGRTEPVGSVEVRPRVSGYIQAVKFQSGQLVTKGDVLFVIDPRWHQAEFDRLHAEAERARVQMDNAKREADRAMRRVRSRFERGIGSELDVARVETELATTEAEAASLAQRQAELENALAILLGANPLTFHLVTTIGDMQGKGVLVC